MQRVSRSLLSTVTRRTVQSLACTSTSTITSTSTLLAHQRLNRIIAQTTPNLFSTQQQIANMSTAATPAASSDVKYWAVHYDYIPEIMEKRGPFRPAHLEMATKLKAEGKMLLGGAFTEAPMGALLVFHGPRSVPEEFVKNDPYVINKLVTSYQIREWTVVIGQTASPQQAQVGDAIAKGVVLHEGTPASEVKTDDLFASGKIVVFGVPGSWTPGCSKTHLPGYIADAEKIKAKGVKDIVCVSVNDAFTHSAWGDALGATGKVRMLADPQADFARSLGLTTNLAKLGGIRSKRFSMVVEDGKITQLNVEPDAGTGLTCSLSSVLKL